MTILPKAPLVEAIFELRWANVEQTPDKGVALTFSNEDSDLFQGQFHSVALERGFKHTEAINREAVRLPHIVTYRYRRKENSWPCYQVGLGVFSANQLNDGYDWESFKTTIMDGLDMLDKGHPCGLANLPAIGVELRYQDAFILEEGETHSEFLENKLSINLSLPEDFLKQEDLDSNIKGHSLTLNLNTLNPKGVVIIQLQEAIIKGKSGFVLSTTIRSADENVPTFDMESFDTWLEDAHNLQKHAFSTFIEPSYAKTFK